MMDAALIQRYQPNGDIYKQLAATRGVNVANAAAAAALTGDEGNVNKALVSTIYGAPLNTDKASILLNQLETNPLGAPIDAANGIIKKTFGDLVSNPLAVLTGLAVIYVALKIFQEIPKKNLP